MDYCVGDYGHTFDRLNQNAGGIKHRGRVAEEFEELPEWNARLVAIQEMTYLTESPKRPGSSLDDPAVCYRGIVRIF